MSTRPAQAQLRFRPFSGDEADYVHLAAIQNAAWPDNPLSAARWRHFDAHWESGYLYRRLIVERDGRPVAYAHYCQTPWSEVPGKFQIGCTVHPDQRRRGVARAAYDHVMAALAPHAPAQVIADAREDQPDALAFLARRGFETRMRFMHSQLALADFDPARFAGLTAKLATAGLRLESLAALARRDPEGWRRKWYELICDLLVDVPAPDPIRPEPFEAFCARIAAHPNFDPAAHFVALDGEAWVGYSGLWPNEVEADRFDTGLSGVRRSHRRKGVCTALKVRGIAYAKGRGVARIKTDNEEHNPMYQLNLALGFKPQPAWINHVKAMAGA